MNADNTYWECHSLPDLKIVLYYNCGKSSTAQLSGFPHEYTSMRNTAGVIDITPMHKYEIKGDDAKKFINKLITKDITNIVSNQVTYGIWCNEDGMVIDDGTIFCFNENHFRIFCAERNLNWFSDTGTGLGLSIAKHILENHQGNIVVNSNVNDGSEFIITLPLDKTNITP